MKDTLNIKRKFHNMERNVLLLIALPLPLFSLAYLYTISNNFALELPAFPLFFDPIALGFAMAILVLQYVGFSARIKKIRNSNSGLELKLSSYSKAITIRYWQLFWVGLVCSAGLLIYENPGFTIAYAITLVFVSLGKPTPDRIVKLLRLKGEEKELVYTINKRE